MWKIYRTTNTINGHTYIGQTKREGKKLEEYLGSGYYLRRAINYYGKEFFIKEILIQDILSQEEANLLEEKYIRELAPDYNIATVAGGGNLGEIWLTRLNEKMHSEEYRKNMRTAQNKPEVKRQKSESMKKARLRLKSSWGRTSNHSQIMRKLWQSPEFREKMKISLATNPAAAEALTSKWKDPEFREKMSEQRRQQGKGNTNGNKKIKCDQLNKVFLSLKEAAAYLEVTPACLSVAIQRNGNKIIKRGKLKGLSFEFI